MENHQLPKEDIKGRKEQENYRTTRKQFRKKSYYKSLPINNYLRVKGLNDPISKYTVAEWI